MKIITFGQLRHRWPLYLLLLPSLAFICTFSYFPAISAVYHSLYRWDGDEVEVFIGLDNFEEALGDSRLHSAFGVVLILIVANLFKMIPSIITAVMIHRMISERARYIYRVLFVVPMIIPGMVWLLLWKFFYDPYFGPLNRLLNATGLMRILEWLNSPEHGLPWLASKAEPVRASTVGVVFGSVPLMILAGAGVLILRLRENPDWRGRLWLAIRVAGYALLALGIMGALGPMWSALRTAVLTNTSKAWAEAGAGLWKTLKGHPELITLAALAVGTVALRGFRPIGPVLKWMGGILIVGGAVVFATTMWWTEPTDAFQRIGGEAPTPAWLGHQDLMLPAFIFWGFPWVAVVSVLIYLSGLGNIDQSIYDAAEIDGCGWFRKFWNVELPLIMTQVRLNLILMCIGTLKAWGLVFILFGDTGGPQGKLMVPGLYMFWNAFTNGRAGYGCAIGLILFFVILILTMINNRYVRVSK